MRQAGFLDGTACKRDIPKEINAPPALREAFVYGRNSGSGLLQMLIFLQISIDLAKPM